MSNATLFDALAAAIEAGYGHDANTILAHCEALGVEGITHELAESAQRVGDKWLHEQEHGNGEWSRMRHDAERDLTIYIHTQCGDVATAEMWRDDFEKMDKESWFGLPYEECKKLHWLKDAHFLVDAVYNTEAEAWDYDH